MSWDAVFTVGVVLMVSLLSAASGVTAMVVGTRMNETDTAKTMQETMDYLSKRVDELERAKDQLREQVDYLSDYIRVLVSAMRTADVEVPQPPPRKGSQAALTIPNDGIYTLSERLKRHFDNEEMAELALQIGLNIEDVAGDSHTAKALKLAQAADRRGILPELVAAAKAARTKVNWD